MFNNNPPYHNGMNYQADGRYIGNMLDNMNDDEFMNNDMMAGGELNPADQLNPMQPLYGDAQGYAQNYQQQPQQYDSSVYPPSSYGNRETDSFQQQHQHKSGVFGEIGERSWEEKEEKQEVEVVDHGPEFEKLSALVEQLPAKPLTGYFIFMNKYRAEVQAENKGVSVGEIAKVLGKRWKECPQEERDQYKAQSAAMRSAYDEKLKELGLETSDVKLVKAGKAAFLRVRNGGELSASKKRGKGDSCLSQRDYDKLKKLVDQLPKRPLSGYFLFLGERRAGFKESNPGKSVAEASKVLGAQWKELSEAEKKVYKDKSAADKATFEGKMAELGLSNSDLKQFKAGPMSDDKSVAPTLPVAVVKRVMNLNGKTRVGKEATMLVSRAAEEFIQLLARSAQQVARRNKRKTVQEIDVDTIVLTGKTFEFLQAALYPNGSKPSLTSPKASRANKKQKTQESKDNASNSTGAQRSIAGFFQSE